MTGEKGSPRIRLNRANYVEDDDESNYIKIQYEAYIPEDRFVGETIGELALMTQDAGSFAFARMTFPAFTKEPNTVVQVIWEVSIIAVESSTRYAPPVKRFLREALEKGIDVLEKYPTDPEGYEGAREVLNSKLQPATAGGTALYYLLNDNQYITQDVVNNFLSEPFVSLENTGLIPLIHLFDPDWQPNSMSEFQ